jgi:hypothetical protein
MSWPYNLVMATETTLIQNGPAADPDHGGVSLSAAAELTGTNRQFLKGFAVAIGIRLVSIGTAKAMSRRDFERLKQHLAMSEAHAST